MSSHRDYTGIKAVNWSSLKLLATSPLLYRWRQDHPEPDKPAWVIGRAVHTAVLEPDQLWERYVIWEGGRRYGKKWDAFLAEAELAEREVLREQDMHEVHAMADAVHDHEEASRVLTGGRAEETVTWTDERTRLECKGRLDFIAPTRLVDLKTTRDVDPRGFGRAAARYGYHGQLAYYHDGGIAAGVLPPDAEPPLIVAAENQPPWDVAVYRVEREALEAGRAWYRSLLGQLLASMEADWWPGVAPGVTALELPGWAPGMEGEDEPTEEVF